MRRHFVVIIAVTLSMVVLVVVSNSGGADPPPPSVVPPGCTEVGTEGRDIMSGNAKEDHICSLGGNDYIASNGHADTLHAGNGSDTAVGGKGRDLIMGNAGSDRLFAIDQVDSNDVIRGGAGNDRCFGEHGDHFFGCEHIYRVGTSPAVDATIKAWARAFLGIAQLGELFQNGEVVIPPGTLTTSTPLPTFPACTPPPPVTPGGSIGPCVSQTTKGGE